MEAKRAAGRYAADLVENNTVIGLGTGRTVAHVLERLAERIRDQGLQIQGVPTSRSTESKAEALGIPLTTLDRHPRLAVAIDGADEVDAERRLIKGGGGALMREKVVAAASAEMVVVVTENKVVDRLGVDFLLPVEVLPFAQRRVCLDLKEIGCEPFLRRLPNGQPFVSDNGHYIVDCRFPDGIQNPADLEITLDRMPGIVECGLFIGLAGRIVIGHEDGSVEIR